MSGVCRSSEALRHLQTCTEWVSLSPLLPIRVQILHTLRCLLAAPMWKYPSDLHPAALSPGWAQQH